MGSSRRTALAEAQAELAAARAQVADQAKMIAFYQGEGEPELPEEAEYEWLASKSRRTPAQDARLRELARQLTPIMESSSLAQVKAMMEELGRLPGGEAGK